MRNTRLPDKIKIVPCVAPTAGAAAGMTETEVDGTGYSRVMWIVQTGAAASGATINFKIQSAVATGMGSAADVVGAALTEVADTGGAAVYAIDMPVDPAKPFMIPVGVVGVDTFANSAIAILYKGTDYPVASTQFGELVTL